ncbi:MAG: hypothetical protein ABI378_09000 [Chitinophagaceae bacterium]
MKQLISFTLLLLVSSACFAQKEVKKGHNVYTLSLNGSNQFNKLNVDYGPTNTIFPKNTFCYTASAEYSRITRYGLILTVGLDYGSQKHSFNVIQHLDTFDREAIKGLKGATFNSGISATNKYFGLKVMIGYSYAITPTWNIIGKAGFRECFYTTGKPLLRGTSSVTYNLDNDSNSFRQTNFNTLDFQFGEDPNSAKVPKWFPWTGRFANWEFYLGAEKKIKSFWIESVGLGINARRTVEKAKYPSATDYYLTSWGDATYSQSYYYERNFTMGLTLSVNF